MKEIFVEERPWGKFERFTLNEPSTVKLIYVNPGQRLSLQYHIKRSEFWKIVSGPVMVEIEGIQKILNTGDTISIPCRSSHRLQGLQDQAIILEISFGEFDELDIIRLQDDYNRVKPGNGSRQSN